MIEETTFYVIYGWLIPEEDKDEFPCNVLTMDCLDYQEDFHYVGIIKNELISGEVLLPDAVTPFVTATVGDYSTLLNQGAYQGRIIEKEVFERLESKYGIPRIFCLMANG